MHRAEIVRRRDTFVIIAYHLKLCARKEHVKCIQPMEQQSEKYNPEFVYHASNDSGNDLTIDVDVNGKNLKMMIDIGCAKTLTPNQQRSTLTVANYTD